MMGRQSNNANAQREQILQQLNTSYKIYVELKGNLREGIQVSTHYIHFTDHDLQFYTNLQDILKQFGRKCEDFAFARQTEKQDLLKYSFIIHLIFTHYLPVTLRRKAQPQQSQQPQPQYNPYQQPQQPQQQPVFTQAPYIQQPTYYNPQMPHVAPLMPGGWQPNMKAVYQQPPPPTYQQPQPYPPQQQPPPTYQQPPYNQQPYPPPYGQGYPNQPPYRK
jgi:hypothetical protein